MFQTYFIMFFQNLHPAVVSAAVFFRFASSFSPWLSPLSRLWSHGGQARPLIGDVALKAEHFRCFKEEEIWKEDLFVGFLTCFMFFLFSVFVFLLSDDFWWTGIMYVICWMAFCFAWCLGECVYLLLRFLVVLKFFWFWYPFDPTMIDMIDLFLKRDASWANPSFVCGILTSWWIILCCARFRCVLLLLSFDCFVIWFRFGSGTAPCLDVVYCILYIVWWHLLVRSGDLFPMFALLNHAKSKLKLVWEEMFFKMFDPDSQSPQQKY